MSNVHRKRWDLGSNGDGMKEYYILDADSCDAGDLMWYDRRTRSAKPFSHADAWTGSTDGSQGKVAENFIGSAMSAKVAGSGYTKVRISARGVYGYMVTTAATFEPGDYVTASKDPAGNLLYAQQIDKAALISGKPDEPTTRGRELAIGKAAVRYPVATTGAVEIEIQGTREAGSSPRQYLTS